MDSSRTNPRSSFSERSLDMFTRIDSKVNISDMKDKDEYEERDDENVLTEKDLQTLQASFNKLDKRNTGSIKPAEIVDVFRFSGQNPTNDEINKMVQEADEPGTGMLMFTEMIPIIEKYWRNYENYTDELKEACLAFDRKDTGIMVFDDMKEILMKYGEPFDEDELELFESSVNVSDGKIIVDDFIKLMSPLATETKKKKKGGKKGKGKKGASPKRK